MKLFFKSVELSKHKSRFSELTRKIGKSKSSQAQLKKGLIIKKSDVSSISSDWSFEDNLHPKIAENKSDNQEHQQHPQLDEATQKIVKEFFKICGDHSSQFTDEDD